MSLNNEPLWPIVAQMTPSPEQVPAIQARASDVVVTAGAGAGKTRTLVARYLALLADGMPLRTIVAITFTKKAAREMRNRVREEMRRYLDSRALADEERARWLRLYSELDAARIDTIHGFCTEILRAHPAEVGVDPRFQVIEEGQGRLLIAQAIDDGLGWAANAERLLPLFGLLGERDLRATVETLVAKRLEAQDAFAQLPTDPVANYRRLVAQRQQQILDALVADIGWAANVSVLHDNVADDANDALEEQRRMALACADGTDGTFAERVQALAGLDRINLQRGSGKAWPGGKEQQAEVREALKDLRALWRARQELVTASWSTVDENMAAALVPLRELWRWILARYEAFKRERDALDFDDLEGRALALLEQNEAVCERWQREVGALLVDEFQDTNERQRRLIDCLNGHAGKLFIVGDAKQSIYRFRGADVTVFREVRLQIQATGGKVLSLDTSYRAHRELIQGLNDLLRPVLGEHEDAARPWVEPFAALGPFRPEPSPGFAAPHVELHLTLGSKGSGALERAAMALAARLRKLVEGDGIQIKEGGRLRPLNYGDVALLCRGSTSFGDYEDAFEAAGIPFLTVAGRGFYSRPEVRDVLNALQAISDPTDDQALVGLLCSPAFAVPDADIHGLVQAKRDAHDPGALWEWLVASKETLTGEMGARVRRAVDAVAALHARAGRTSVADLLKAFLDQTDYAAALVQARQARSARNVDKLLDDAHKSNIVGVGEFLEYVAGLRDTGTREGEARSTPEGAVQIMSVHAAKGLEFPVVVMGDVTYSGATRNPVLFDSDFGVVLPLTDADDELALVYRLAKERELDQDAAESDRLLYVAATRAREKLILSGCAGVTKKDELGKVEGWLGRLTGPDVLNLEGCTLGYNPDGDATIAIERCVGKTPVACRIYEPKIAWGLDGQPRPPFPAPPLAIPPPLLAPVAALAEYADDKTAGREREPAEQVWSVVPRGKRPWAPRWVVGAIVHEALAIWRIPEDKFEQWAESRARGRGIADPEQIQDAIRQSRRLLARFRAQPLYREMDGARRLHEVPYSLIVEGRVESGIIDALYESGGVWTVIEFKTDHVKDEAKLQELLEKKDYRKQAGRYVAAVKALLGQTPKVKLCMLDYKNSVHVFKP